jgi:copper chaperone CopZ
MKKTYKVLNVKCGGCANTLKKDLLSEFGKVDVNLDVMPREITLQIDDNKSSYENLKAKLRKMGYPFEDDELSTLESIGANAKSFVSCAIGKIDNMSHKNDNKDSK